MLQSTATTTYIRDTKDLIAKLEDLPVPRGAILATLDVGSLYTNIPLETIRGTIENLLRSRQEQTPPYYFLIQLLDIVFENNFFRYKNDFYIQTKGVAMGAALAPSVANIHMIDFENKHFFSESNPFTNDIILIKRYIDDLLIIFKSEATCIAFQEWVNTLDSHLKFTCQYHKKEIPFLDVVVYISNRNTLAFKPYKKLTDCYSLLHYSSSHPSHLKRNLPYGQLIRLKRNATDKRDYRNAAHQLEKALVNRGYPNCIIQDAYRRVDGRNRKNLLETRSDSIKNRKPSRLVMGMDFTPLASHIRNIIYKHWHIVEDIPGCKDPPLLGLRKKGTLRNQLVKADCLESPSIVTKGHYRCGSCNMCPYSLQVKEIKSEHMQFTFKINSMTTCNSKNVVYCIRCPCNKLYIGSTTRALKVRIGEHRSRIRNKVMEAPLTPHFLQMKHSDSDLMFFGLWQYTPKKYHKQDILKILRQQETKLIFMFKTLQPDGLNSDLDLSVFI
ncbi:uncharacterized protein LOC132591893 [Zootoca vivipara]|uniref:uncharacterized protein LOC132591893 n=1 Tax=Zootoca vivipara TaxID=8524 RepID=UPI00293BB4B4|nr:uncharacterized protein LOC132591893 [Zootoca vivipara]